MVALIGVFQVINIIWWYVLLLIISYSTYAIFFKYFRTLHDNGLAISKLLGIIIVFYVIYVLGFFKIVSVQILFYLVPLLFVVVGVVFYMRSKAMINKQLKQNKEAMIIIEAIFFICFILFILIRMQAPEAYGTEKFMDFGIMNSALRTEHLPLEDMWFSGKNLNYYYFGHFTAAGLTRLSSATLSSTALLSSAGVGYNLMLATLFALSVIISFGIAYNFTRKIRYGLLAGFFTCIAGNLQPFIQIISTGKLSELSYWPASRIIEHTINEFPFFAFIHGDLHAHVFAIPVFLGFVYIISHILSKLVSSRSLYKEFGNSDIYAVSFFFAVSYMTSSWDVISESILFALVLVLLLKLNISRNHRLFRSLGIVLKTSIVAVIVFVILALPNIMYIHNNFTIGIVAEQSPISGLMTIYGLFSILILVYLIAISTQISVQDTSLKNQKVKKDFINILLIASVIIILPTELFFIDHPFGRMNTVFKLGMHAWLLLGIGSALIIYHLFNQIKNSQNSNNKILIRNIFTVLFAIIIVLASIYPVVGIVTRRSHYAGTIDSTSYLDIFSPSESRAIDFLNENIKISEGRPVVLEASGKDYGFSNIVSVNTGLPTLMGWEGHEMQWNPDADVYIRFRQMDVNAIYSAEDKDLVEALIDKYKVKYIYFGQVEKQRYRRLTNVLGELTETVFENGDVRVLKVID